MSKIERALRKAEEERRRKQAASPPVVEPAKPISSSVVHLNADEKIGPFAELSESFRKIAARLKSCCENVGARDVLFTSAVSKEGKTTAAANCAISLSQDFNMSVCLVDFDLRHPSLSRFFGSNSELGIADALKGQVEVASIIQPTSIRNLSIVHAQKAGRSSLPLLSNERLGKIIYELRTRFDFLVMDSPPVLPVADAVVLSKKASAVVLVIEPGRTRRKHIEQILEQIERGRIMGFIMNYRQYRVPQTYNYSKYYDYRTEPNAQSALEQQ
jgi:capsular exopolysaccharide synthesis family protein